MKTNPDSIRPQPDAYDDLWLLLPVFLVFLALVAGFADTVPYRGPQSGQLKYRVSPLPMANERTGQDLRVLADPSVPPASTAITADATVESRDVSSF